MSFSAIAYDVLQLVGSLGLFLFGVKFMSDAIQKMAGSGMKAILNFMTNHPLKGILTGFIITVIVQSSTITTVLLVGFVNAGMMTLAQSIGVIMGANIGTTITGWIISVLELKMHFSAFSLPIIGLAFPFIFSKNNTYKYFAYLTIGFALMFLGFSFLKESVPEIQKNPELLAFVQDYTDMGHLSIFIFILVGGVLTFVLQSSSAAITLTIILIFNGWIDIRTGAAMILGENIGTTFTAQIAALVANTNAKRAAMAHSIFNLFGVIWMFVFFNPFLNFIEWVINGIDISPPAINGSLPDNEITYQGALTLSLFHTTFNVCNTFLLYFFRSHIAQVTEWILPQQKAGKGVKHQNLLKNSFIATPEVGLFKVNKELQNLCKQNHRLFNLLHMLAVRKSINTSKLLDRFNQTYEESGHSIEQINLYLSELANTDYGENLTRPIRLAWDNLNHLTEVNDLCLKLARKIKDAHLSKISLSEGQINALTTLLTTLNKAFDAAYNSFNVQKYRTWQLKHGEVEDFKAVVFELKEDISEAQFLQIENGSIAAQVAFVQIELSELSDRLAYHLDKIRCNSLETKGKLSSD